MKTIMPSRSPLAPPSIQQVSASPPKFPAKQSEEAEEDESFDFGNLSQVDFSNKIASLRSRTNQRRGVYYPDELRAKGLPSVLESPVVRRSTSGDSGGSRRSVIASPSVNDFADLLPNSRRSSLKASKSRVGAAVAALSKYVEDDNDDYEDVFQAEHVAAFGTQCEYRTEDTLEAP